MTEGYFKTELGEIHPAYVQSFETLADFQKEQPAFSKEEAKRIYNACKPAKKKSEKADSANDDKA